MAGAHGNISINGMLYMMMEVSLLCRQMLFQDTLACPIYHCWAVHKQEMFSV